MSFKPPTTGGASTPTDSPGNPPAGQAGKLAAQLAAKAGGKGTATKAPLIAAPGTKGGRKSVAEESAAFLQSRNLVAVPADSAGAAGIVQTQPAPYLVTPEFVGDAVRTVLKGVEKWDVQKVTFRTKKLCGNDAVAKEMGEAAAAPPGCIETVGRSFEELSRKYPMILQWAPELTVCGALGAWAMKRAELGNKLTELEAQLKKQLEAASSPKAPAPGAPPTEYNFGGDNPKPKFGAN